MVAKGRTLEVTSVADEAAVVNSRASAVDLRKARPRSSPDKVRGNKHVQMVNNLRINLGDSLLVLLQAPSGRNPGESVQR